MLKNSSLRKNFTDLRYLTARHIKLYFKDKQTFFMSLITPLILVVLFATFLRSVYVSSLLSVLPEGVVLPDKLVNGFCRRLADFLYSGDDFRNIGVLFADDYGFRQGE